LFSCAGYIAIQAVGDNAQDKNPGCDKPQKIRLGAVIYYGRHEKWYQQYARYGNFVREIHDIRYILGYPVTQRPSFPERPSGRLGVWASGRLGNPSFFYLIFPTAFGGQYLKIALPMIYFLGTKPQYLESRELPELSPSI
jgi:hypothetical protein